MEKIRTEVNQSEPFLKLKEWLSSSGKEKSVSLTGMNGSLPAFAVDLACRERRSQILVILRDKDAAEKLRDDCALLRSVETPHLYVQGHFHAGTLLDMSAPVAQVEAFRSLLARETSLIIASVEAVVQPVPPPDVTSKRIFSLDKGKEYPFSDLLATLAELGFERKDFVEGYGDVAVRGGILDIFPFVGEHPLRVEFWGNSVESIREFDPLSQRSIRHLTSATVAASLANPEKQNKATVFDYLEPNALVVLDDPIILQKEIDELRREGMQGILEWEDLKDLMEGFPRMIHSVFPDSAAGEIIDVGSQPQPVFHGSMKLLVEELSRSSAQGYHALLLSDTKEERLRIEELIEDERQRSGAGSNHLRYSLEEETVHSGFVFPAAKLVVLVEHEIFGRLKKRGGRKLPRWRGFSQRDVSRLKGGDYVVHSDYGIGKFDGLQKIVVRGIEQEVMKLQYDENDVLYVNLNFVSRVQKYSSKEGHEPALTKLGTAQWDRVRARARKRIKDIARDLIRLYARRKHEPGTAFSPDTHWQREMEASFMYEDTPDQAKATQDVKADMEVAAPMDRLICGDVGFGKTEVAVRGAFKAVLDGKQVAVLVPTTILAQQHLLTFIDRLGKYTVRVESLTRFKSKKEQTSILERVKDGSVDIVIGTHRLLSGDVAFKNLGLLVVDEEHRFGVSAKEKLRQLKASVDTLTMTATPIPRTLQFSLLGARDLSLINTPPRNRLPIETEIVQFDMQLVREAILRELHRGGQVYFIHDRIQSMDDILEMLRRHVPEARFQAAHGQLKGHELERTMLEFLDRKYDVLVCTKIIESGIDIPSVNTIIIHRADRFGLAELYQLRGRVGRANVQAYAYLLTPPLSSLPRLTLQRLQAIQEFTELGSGFNLAMRDMEIRGAGNLLGAEQSGYIMEMGFEMYQRVVEDAVRELKDEEFAELFRPQSDRRGQRTDTEVQTDVEALIPDVYIESDSERLDIYRRLYAVTNAAGVQAMREELQDRFGEFPEEVESLLKVVEIKTAGAPLGLRKIELQGDNLTFLLPPPEEKTFYEETNGKPAPFQAVMESLGSLARNRPRLKQEGQMLKLELFLTERESNRRLDETRQILEQLAGKVVPLQESEVNPVSHSATTVAERS